MKKIIATSVLSIALVAALSACGSNGSTGSTGSADGKSTPAASATPASGNTITVNATNFAFEPAEIKVKKGDKVTLKLANKQGMHGIAQPDLKIDLKKDGDTATFTADKAGTYEFICSVMCGAGHASMKGKIVVE